jgi:hypothetical protein
MKDSMELVTLAHVAFNRIGSATQHGMVRHKQEEHVGEVANEEAQTLREYVIGIAEKLGELPGSLHRMTQAKGWDHSHQTQVWEFNIQGPSTHYGEVYATCYAHPALKIGGRYFKLEEVTFDRMVRHL